MFLMKKKADWREEAATKGYAHEAVESVLKGMQRMFDDFGKKIDKRFDGMENRMNSVEKNLQRQIHDLQWDTPTKRDFDKLEKRVEALERS